MAQKVIVPQKTNYVPQFLKQRDINSYFQFVLLFTEICDLQVEEFCGRCLLEFIDWRYSQSCWYFRPSFVNYCPSDLLSSSPPSPFPVTKYIIYRKCVAGREWAEEMLSCVGDHILQEFNATLYLPRFITYKIVRPAQPNT
jgi:hypothetical protein